jgi:hypothetical protein
VRGRGPPPEVHCSGRVPRRRKRSRARIRARARQRAGAGDRATATASACASPVGYRARRHQRLPGWRGRACDPPGGALPQMADPRAGAAREGAQRGCEPLFPGRHPPARALTPCSAAGAPPGPVGGTATMNAYSVQPEGGFARPHGVPAHGAGADLRIRARGRQQSGHGRPEIDHDADRSRPLRRSC